MDIKKVEDDIEVQGTEYEEDETSDGLSKQKKIVGKGKSTKSNKTIILIAGTIIGVIVIILISIVYMKMQKKKVNEEDYYDTPEFIVDEGIRRYDEFLITQEDNQTEEQDNQNMISYSDDEIEQLRQAGYTGYEIEKFASQGLRVTTKIAEAKAEQRQFFEDNIADYLDGKSEKYKELETYTWLGQDELIFDAEHFEEWSNKETVKNCDYVKVPARGYQTFLRIEITKGKYAYMLVRPERYQQLPQAGNIVVYMKYYTTGDTTIIYQIEEKEIQ